MVKRNKRKYKLKKGVTAHVIRGAEASISNAENMTLKEFSGDNESSSLNLSETDESENEGLGDGKMGRTTGNPDQID